MALSSFDSHLAEVGTGLRELRLAIDKLEGLQKRHDHNNYSTLDARDFTGRQVTKAQYDAAMTSVLNLLDIWLPDGHGTNFDQYLYEVP